MRRVWRTEPKKRIVSIYGDGLCSDYLIPPVINVETIRGIKKWGVQNIKFICYFDSFLFTGETGSGKRIKSQEQDLLFCLR